MELSKVIYLILTILGAGVLLAFLTLAIFVFLHDRWALRAARKYCEENELECIEAKAFQNHYGLYFRKEGKRHYASYDFERNRTITWKKGTPLEIAEKKLKA